MYLNTRETERVCGKVCVGVCGCLSGVLLRLWGLTDCVRAVCVCGGVRSLPATPHKDREGRRPGALTPPVYFCSSRALTRIDTFPSLPLILVAGLYLGSVTVCPALQLGESFFFFKVTSLLLVRLSITPLEAQNRILY